MSPGRDGAVTASPALREAAADLRHLLSRGYPRERCLDLVGDRRALPREDREMLRRGVFAPETAARRAARLLDPRELAGRAVALDGHNLLIILETALTGGRLVCADDGVMRDISRIGRHHSPGETTRRAAGLILEALLDLGAAEVLFLLDAPLPKSGLLAGEIRERMTGLGLPGEARAVDVPERILKTHPGPVASADSEVIDSVDRPVDLAGWIIRNLSPAPAWEVLK